MAAKKQPYGINNIISWGATIVIVGLLFKIQHWQYATLFITLGLGTEALLFLLIGFQRDTVEVDWTRAYPELNDDFDGQKEVKKLAPADNFSTTAALDKMLADAKIGPELIGSLADGLKTFGDKVKTISHIADASEATTEYTKKIKQATASYDLLNTSFEKASTNFAEIAGAAVDSKAYHEQINKITKNLSALNAVYELELQDSGTHLKSMNKFYQDMATTMQSFNESVTDAKQFKDEVGRLAKNLATLNGIYGNMLSAMNPPRVNS